MRQIPNQIQAINNQIQNIPFYPYNHPNLNQLEITNYPYSSNIQQNANLLKKIINNLQAGFNTNMSMNPTQMNMNTNIKKNKNTRVLFKKEEDDQLKKLVKLFGKRHWEIIAQYMNGRTAKQCRDRYMNYLVPGYFQGEWSREEDELLIKLYKENGPKWSIIQKSFVNRSANNIKNRWYYFLYNKFDKYSTEKNEKNVENNESNDTFIENDITSLFDSHDLENDWIV